MEQLVEDLKTRQKELGLSQSRLAEMLGVDQSTVSRLFAGKTRLGLKTVQGITRAFPSLMFAESARALQASISEFAEVSRAFYKETGLGSDEGGKNA